ncbi:hypothetical protein F8388_003059 [Cannabis sativa]|uniref:SNF2 N-terminal domain-containing protein n=1 Tax=Cannabis sativa TaxID=3483 RepID=A0A7J6HDR1_CANSA|nr:hypothetical protein F8388_003059 [Cannabis sativa]
MTTYEVALRDTAALSMIRCCYLMVDEVHRFKTRGGQLYATLLKFYTKNKLLVMGTQLLNSVEKLSAGLRSFDLDKFEIRQAKEEYVQSWVFDQGRTLNLFKFFRGSNP